jgi:hypothetical protein
MAEAELFEKMAKDKKEQAETLLFEAMPALCQKAIEARKSLPEEIPVIEWLKWAKEIGFEWADSAIEQKADSDGLYESLSATIGAAFWYDETKEGFDFWDKIEKGLKWHGL